MTKPNDEDPDTTTANDPPPGPTDHGGKGGMATREVAPDVADGGEEPPD